MPWNAPYNARLGFVPSARESTGLELDALLRAEAANGLDRAKRVAMRLAIT